MKIWIPKALYQIFPVISVTTGFLMVATFRNPLGIVVAALLYIYSFSIMWKRLPG